MSEPTTEAGRALRHAFEVDPCDCYAHHGGWESIVAIEQEAIRDERERFAARVRAVPASMHPGHVRRRDVLALITPEDHDAPED